MIDHAVASRAISQLFRFMLAFKINRFDVIEADAQKILTTIGWPDDGRASYDPTEETQTIVWDVQSLDHIEDALDIVAFLIEKDLIRGDRIEVSPDDLANSMAWPMERFEAALSDLLALRVDMIDDGTRTDFFFLHF